MKEPTFTTKAFSSIFAKICWLSATDIRLTVTCSSWMSTRYNRLLDTICYKSHYDSNIFLFNTNWKQLHVFNKLADCWSLLSGQPYRSQHQKSRLASCLFFKKAKFNPNGRYFASLVEKVSWCFHCQFILCNITWMLTNLFVICRKAEKRTKMT